MDFRSVIGIVGCHFRACSFEFSESHFPRFFCSRASRGGPLGIWTCVVGLGFSDRFGRSDHGLAAGLRLLDIVSRGSTECGTDDQSV